MKNFKKNKKEKGFAIILALVLLLAMSLMGGALVVVASGDHQNNNIRDEYQQTFYIAEIGIRAGENYLLDKFLGPYDETTGERDKSKKDLPINQDGEWNGKMQNKDNFGTKCRNSFNDFDRASLKIVAAQSWNFGEFMAKSFENVTNAEVKKGLDVEAKKLEQYYYEFFITRLGSAPFEGTGGSVKKTASDVEIDGMAYRIYACGIHKPSKRMVVPLETVVVLPR
jgi:Tfp pilus assembly protein PilX